MDQHALIQKIKSHFPDFNGLETDLINYLADFTHYLDRVKDSDARRALTQRVCEFLNGLYASGEDFSDETIRESILEYYASSDADREVAKRFLQGAALLQFDESIREVEYWKPQS